MDLETRALIDGAYGYARNVLIAVITDLLHEGASQERVERLLRSLEFANEQLGSEEARTAATRHTTVALAMLRSSSAGKPERP